MSSSWAWIDHIRRSAFFKETLQHFLVYLLSNILGRGLTLAMLVVLTHFLSPDEYGKYLVFLAVLQIAFTLMPLNAHASVSRYYYDKKDDFPEFVGSTLVLLLAIFALTSPGFLFFRDTIRSTCGLPSTTLLIVPILTFFWTVNAVFEQVYLPLRKSTLLATVFSVRTGLICGSTLTLVLILGKRNHLAPILAECAVFTLFMFFYVYIMRGHCRLSFKTQHLKYIIGYSLPLVPYLLGNALLVQLDRILLARLADNSAAGIYGFASTFGMAFMMISALALQAWDPSYFENAAEGRITAINREAQLIFRITTVGSTMLLFFGKDIGVHISGDAFRGAFDLLPLILGSFLVSVIGKLYLRPMFLKKRTGSLSLIICIAVGISVVMNYLLIPRFGYIGAAEASLAANIFITVATVVVVRRSLRITDQFPLASLLEPLLTFLVLALLIPCLQMWLPPVWSWIGRIALFFAGVALLIWPICRRSFRLSPSPAG